MSSILKAVSVFLPGAVKAQFCVWIKLIKAFSSCWRGRPCLPPPLLSPVFQQPRSAGGRVSCWTLVVLGLFWLVCAIGCKAEAESSRQAHWLRWESEWVGDMTEQIYAHYFKETKVKPS